MILFEDAKYAMINRLITAANDAMRKAFRERLHRLGII